MVIINIRRQPECDDKEKGRKEEEEGEGNGTFPHARWPSCNGEGWHWENH